MHKSYYPFRYKCCQFITSGYHNNCTHLVHSINTSSINYTNVYSITGLTWFLTDTIATFASIKTFSQKFGIIKTIL